MMEEEEEVAVRPPSEEEAPEPIHAISMSWRVGTRSSGRLAPLLGGAKLAHAMARRRGEEGCAAIMLLHGEEGWAHQSGGAPSLEGPGATR